MLYFTCTISKDTEVGRFKATIYNGDTVPTYIWDLSRKNLLRKVTMLMFRAQRLEN